MSYQKEEIGKYVTLKQGFAINKKTNHHMSDEETPLHLLRIGDMKEGFFCMYVKDTIPKNFIAHENDIIYTRTGQVGLVFRNQYGVVHNNCFTVTPNDENVLCREYLYYALQSQEFYTEANNRASGAAQPDLPHNAFSLIKIYLPKLEQQKKIGQILSKYDELIVNNQKQIKLLEEAAQRLYKEWFVDLRFPNYEKHVFADGLPEGWKKIQLRDLGEIITGKTPSTANSSYYGGNIPFVKIPDMHAGIYALTTEKKLTYVGANTQKNKFIPKNSIMVSCIGTAGLVNISCENCQTNQQINSIVLNRGYDLYYGYLVCVGLKDTLNALGSNGATMTNVNKEKFSNIVVVYPSKELLVKFNEYVKPFFEKIFALSAQAIKLSESRDRLLPKLMNGEIEV